ncbi:MAG: hypothetical protein PUB37_10975, partial [Firmicutes bacterium]|nr:hypothetical protein [Bacillota bacterium]
YTTTGNATYYARFIETVTQTYVRQVKNGDNWTDTTDDSIGTLDRYTHSDVVGATASSTATAGEGYQFVGWYDADGNSVDADMLSNGGITLNYTTTGNATYYARFKNSDSGGSNPDDPSNPDTPNNPNNNENSPTTGDNSNPALWFTLLLMSLTVLAGLFFRKIKYCK